MKQTRADYAPPTDWRRSASRRECGFLLFVVGWILRAVRCSARLPIEAGRSMETSRCRLECSESGDNDDHRLQQRQVSIVWRRRPSPKTTKNRIYVLFTRARAHAKSTSRARVAASGGDSSNFALAASGERRRADVATTSFFFYQRRRVG